MKKGIMFIIVSFFYALAFSQSSAHYYAEDDSKNLQKGYSAKEVKVKIIFDQDSINKVSFSNYIHNYSYQLNEDQLITQILGYNIDGKLDYTETNNYDGKKWMGGSQVYADSIQNNTSTCSYNSNNKIGNIIWTYPDYKITRRIYYKSDTLMKKRISKVTRIIHPSKWKRRDARYVAPPSLKTRRYNSQFTSIYSHTFKDSTHYISRASNFAVDGYSTALSKYELKNGNWKQIYSKHNPNYHYKQRHPSYNEKTENFYTYGYLQEQTVHKQRSYSSVFNTKMDSLGNIITEEASRYYDYKFGDPHKYKKSIAAMTGMKFESIEKKKEYIKSIRYETIKTTTTFEYIFDLHNNWIKKSCYEDGVLVKIIEREITYYE